MAYPSVTHTFSDGTANIIYAAQINTNFTDMINGVSGGTKDLNVNGITAAGALTVNGNTTLGNASADTIAINAGTVTPVAGSKHFIPIFGMGPSGTIPTVTISDGTLTPTASVCYVTSETSTSDDMTNISVASISSNAGTMLLLIPTNGHTITFKHNAGGNNPIFLTAGTDWVLTSDYGTLLLVYGNSKWLQIGGSLNHS